MLTNLSGEEIYALGLKLPHKMSIRSIVNLWVTTDKLRESLEINLYNAYREGKLKGEQVSACYFETMISLEDFLAWFASEEIPLPEDCGLAKWWAESEPRTIERRTTDRGGNKPKSYEWYKKSIDDCVAAREIDLTVLKVAEILHQLKLFDKTKWGITIGTFRRDIWPRYSEENNLKKQRGRPRTK